MTVAARGGHVRGMSCHYRPQPPNAFECHYSGTRLIETHIIIGDFGLLETKHQVQKIST